ncbi:glutaredoxin 2 isoform X1 [Thunnus albacares]|uniref:glutaredoxin 2 isoform X1 n=2 Tax=Thunnus maccoyii TaxID=8240 RepID=UPI001C4B24EE|nr:glutaredoxin 2 isoform X1 [Thunnus maccoyii]XP_044217566.1 glutaredoxin 2 isoform X1 [Thunnus albacares]
MFHQFQKIDYFLVVCSFFSMFARVGCLSRVAWTGCRRMGNFTSSTTGGLTSTSCAQYVHEMVSQNCVVIFSKTTCPYCKMAKNVFNEIGATYKVIELDEHNDGRRLQEALAQMTGARTVPRVFINGNCIGGGSDTKQLHQQGKLVPLIEQCAPCCASSGSEGSGSGQFESAK